jgi:hypothetical protein
MTSDPLGPRRLPVSVIEPAREGEQRLKANSD